MPSAAHLSRRPEPYVGFGGRAKRRPRNSGATGVSRWFRSRYYWGMVMALKNERGRDMIDCRAAAERYGCSMRYIRALVLRGHLAADTVGGTYVVNAADVDRLKAKAARGKGRSKPKARGFREG